MREGFKIACIVLAAGMSKRFGGIKQLAEFKGKPLVQYALDAANASKAAYVLFVVGDRSEQILASVKLGRALPVFNKDYSKGLATSIACGVSNLPSDSDAALFLVADQPLLKSSQLNLLMQEFEATGADVVAYSVKGQPRNPMLFSRRLFLELGSLKGDEGAKRLAERHLAKAQLLQIEDIRAFLDIDTKAEMANLETD